MAAGTLVGLQHQQATQLDRAEPVAVTSNQIAVPPAPRSRSSTLYRELRKHRESVTAQVGQED